MKSSTAFRKAAALIEDRAEYYACLAINKVVTGYRYAMIPRQTTVYMEIMGFRSSGGHNGFFGWPHAEESRHQRIVSLCLAAAVSASEGD